MSKNNKCNSAKLDGTIKLSCDFLHRSPVQASYRILLIRPSQARYPSGFVQRALDVELSNVLQMR